jgi:hypothetical protein
LDAKRFVEVVVTKVVVRKLGPKNGKHRPASVAETRVRSASGRFMDVYTVDDRSRTFDDDLTYVFRSNIDKARRENRKLFGSPDGRRKK